MNAWHGRTFLFISPFLFVHIPNTHSSLPPGLSLTVTNLSKSWPFGLFLPHQQTHSPASCIRWPLHPILTIHFIHAFHSLSLQHGKVIEKKGKREDINNKQMKGEELTILTTIIICWRDKFTSPQLNSKSYHSPHPSRS